MTSDARFVRVRLLLEQNEWIAAGQDILAWTAVLPNEPGALTCLGHLMRLQGRYQEATEAVARALAASPDFAPALVERARLAAIEGAQEQAHAWFERAHVADPAATDWLEEWAHLLLRLQRHRHAARVAARLCESQPGHSRGWFLLGVAQHQARSLAAALEAYGRAAALDPELPMLRNNTAALHYELRDYQTALTVVSQAIDREPGNHLAWTNLANIQLARREPDNALLAAEQACALAPDYLLAWVVHAKVLRELQRWDGALEAITRAARIAPGDPGVQWSLAMLQLLRGDYRNGLVNHEARWAGSPELGEIPPFFPERRWRGENLAGKTLLIWGEQGFGDVIQFVRFIPQMAELARRAGGQLIYCCVAGLFPLFERSLAGHALRIVPHDLHPLPAFDLHLPLASIPLMLGITLDNLPAEPAYLKADPVKVAQWGQRLSATEKYKVGLVWSGSRTHQRNPLRAVDVAAYAEAFRSLPGVAFHSLQVDGQQEVREAGKRGLGMVDFTTELSSFDETAAYISNLDLVITVCTSVAHLSGAIGVPTWLLLDVNPHWVWKLGCNDSAWYPTIRLFRQQRYGDWAPVLREVRSALASMGRVERAST